MGSKNFIDQGISKIVEAKDTAENFFNAGWHGLEKNLLGIGAATLTAANAATDLAAVYNSQLGSKGAINATIEKYQSLNIEIAKLGRGDTSAAIIENMRLQAYETQKLGISLNNLKDANVALLTSYNGSLIITDKQTKGFNDQKNAMAALIEFSQKFGVERRDSIGILNLFNNTLGGGAKEAQKLSDQMLIFSQKTGQSANKVFSEFNSEIDRFIVLGADKAVASFQKIELAAARTGMPISNVIGAIQRFDDIESGFQAGGQLNRVLSFLGGSFDTFKAIQSDDEERAKMLFEAISGVAGKFGELQTTQAKRSFAKQIADETGIDLKTVMGLLNKSSNMSGDLKDIMNKGAVREEFTNKGRETAGQNLTTSMQFGEIQKEFVQFGPYVTKLSGEMHKDSVIFTDATSKIVKRLDIITGKLASGKEGSFKAAADAYIKGISEIPNIIDGMIKSHDAKKGEINGIITGNTQVVADHVATTKILNEILSKGIKVEGTINTPYGDVSVQSRNPPTKSLVDAAH